MTTLLRRLTHAEPALIPGLAFLLRDAVQDGASVGFLHPLQPREAEAYWQEAMQALSQGQCLWVAERRGELVGTVQLSPCSKPNGRHRAEVQKLLVRRSAQGQGIASALMRTLERHATTLGCSLLYLDTQSDSKAETVYRHLGWTQAGIIPDYASLPDGRRCATSIYFKFLDPTDRSPAHG